MNCSVFTYGTLEITDVMEAVTGRMFGSKMATADGYVRFLLKGRNYPGMTPSYGQVKSGHVYFEVDDHSLVLLDQFEDEVCVRHLISVQIGNANWLKAFAYIIEPKHKGALSPDPWIKEEFVAKHLSAYIAACRNFYLTASRSSHIQSSNC